MINANAPFELSEVRFFGLDVHKKTITIAESGIGIESRCVTTLANDPKAIEEFFKKALKCGPVYTTYEAGACGYVLDRQLKKLGIPNIVAAPSKIYRVRGEIKNDKRDAIKSSELLRNHMLFDKKALHPVHVPEQEDLGIREKSRQRKSFKSLAVKARNQITSMLQRYNIEYNRTKTLWVKTHRAWLQTVKFESSGLQNVFREYLDHLEAIEKRLSRCEAELDEMVQGWNKKALVDALSCFKGIKQLSAIVHVSEIGKYSRFKSARSFMGYVGLNPSEHSSGEKVTRGPITKTGNKRVRTNLVEAANLAYLPPKTKEGFFATCPQEVPEWIKERAYEASLRLHKRYWALVRRGKPSNVAKIAVARELAGFIWDVARRIEENQKKDPDKNPKQETT